MQNIESCSRLPMWSQIQMEIQLKWLLMQKDMLLLHIWWKREKNFKIKDKGTAPEGYELDGTEYTVILSTEASYMWKILLVEETPQYNDSNNDWRDSLKGEETTLTNDNNNDFSKKLLKEEETTTNDNNNNDWRNS